MMDRGEAAQASVAALIRERDESREALRMIRALVDRPGRSTVPVADLLVILGDLGQ